MNFSIKCYGLQELALFYFPLSSPAAASCQFKKWINRSQQLKDNLTEAGYTNGQKLLTPRQVKLIVDHVGEP